MVSYGPIACGDVDPSVFTGKGSGSLQCVLANTTDSFRGAFEVSESSFTDHRV